MVDLGHIFHDLVRPLPALPPPLPLTATPGYTTHVYTISTVPECFLSADTYRISGANLCHIFVGGNEDG